MKEQEYKEYRATLEELVKLLGKYHEPRWHQYFSVSLDLLNSGKAKKSVSHSLKAFGGMGSFNDELYFTGAPIDEAELGYELREKLWNQCQN